MHDVEKPQYKVTSIGKGSGDGSSKSAFMAAMLVLLTDWSETERRQGRRGEYATTGAQSFRLREIPGDVVQAIQASLEALGHEVSEEEIAQCFDNEFDYQVSYSINRFPLAKTSGLTSADVKAIDRVKTLISGAGTGRIVKQRLAG